MRAVRHKNNRSMGLCLPLLENLVLRPVPQGTVQVIYREPLLFIPNCTQFFTSPTTFTFPQNHWELQDEKMEFKTEYRNLSQLGSQKRCEEICNSLEILSSDTHYPDYMQTFWMSGVVRSPSWWDYSFCYIYCFRTSSDKSILPSP